MFDDTLRKVKDRLLSPLAGRLANVPPAALTLAGLGAGLGSAVAAAWGDNLAGLALWAVNRTLDGLDGLVARKFGKTSDRGGYLDLVCDFVVYAAIPLGLAWARADASVWAACAFLLASFYINAVSWLALSALHEKLRQTTEPNRLTSLAMPKGLMEGFETLLLYAAFFLWPGGLVWLSAGGAALVLVSAGQRVIWALRGGVK